MDKLEKKASRLMDELEKDPPGPMTLREFCEHMKDVIDSATSAALLTNYYYRASWCEANGHDFFTKDDFTIEEIVRRNELAMAVIRKNRMICKNCGYEPKRVVFI